jgi:hypothetical protein
MGFSPFRQAVPEQDTFQVVDVTTLPVSVLTISPLNVRAKSYNVPGVKPKIPGASDPP